ncbi:transposase [Deinococcus sp.]|uniref:transposase n=1 Tax=Deinococcus sp. TaxID=47478 RepID=UPI003C7E82C2
MKGRKRHLIVDTLGLLLKVKVLPAKLSDREGGKQLLTELHGEQPTLKLHLFADGGYQGPWEAWVKSIVDFTVEIGQTLGLRRTWILAPRGAGTDRSADQDVSRPPQLRGGQKTLDRGAQYCLDNVSAPLEPRL